MTVQKFISTLTILKFALGVGVLLPTVIFYLLVSQKVSEPISPEFAQTMSLLPFPGILLIIGSNYLYKMLLGNIKANVTLANKLKMLQSFLIIRWAMIESGGLLALVSYLLVQTNYVAIFIGVLAGFQIILTNISANQIIIDLELNPDEREVLQNPNQKVM